MQGKDSGTGHPRLFQSNYIIHSGWPPRMACVAVDEAIGATSLSQVPCHLHNSSPGKFHSEVLGASSHVFLAKLVYLKELSVQY